MSIETSLRQDHLASLKEESSIGKDAIEDRGYRTVTDSAELSALGFNDAQAACVPALLIPIHGVDGDIVGYQIRPDSPRLNDHDKPVKYETIAGWSMRLDIPPGVRKFVEDPSETLWITEGLKKADSGATRGMAIIGLIGVWNWKGANASGGSVELADWDRIPIKGRKICIVYDSDVMRKPQVRQALRRLAAMLRRRGAKSVEAIVPPQESEAKCGLDDYFARGGTIAELERCADSQILSEPVIVINNRELRDVVDEAVMALVEYNEPPKLFVRGGEVARVSVDERGLAKIAPVTTSSLRDNLTSCASWVKKLKEGEQRVFPPKDVPEVILSRTYWPFPPIIGVTKSPVLGRDGLSTMPGYSPDSHYFVSAKQPFLIDDRSPEDAAAYLIDDLLGDFPLADDASIAHALALMLLPMVRPAISGPTPLHLIDAPVQGSGKSLLAKVCLSVSQGVNISTTSGDKQEEEWRKSITTALSEGRPYVFLDNLTKRIANGALAAALTSTEWEDRKLQETRSVNVPIRCVWVATGNNVELGRDFVRRALWIRLDPGQEYPEEHDGYKHADILGHIKQNRRKHVGLLCRIIQGWLDKGRPKFSGKGLGSYEEHNAIIGGILESCGVPGFLTNIELLREATDYEHAIWIAFVQRWYESYGFGFVQAKPLLELASEDEEFMALLGDRSTSGKAARLAALLRGKSGSIIGGCFGAFRFL